MAGDAGGHWHGRAVLIHVQIGQDLMPEDPALYNSRLIKNYLEYLQHAHAGLNADALLDYSRIRRAEVEDPGHWLTQEQVNRFHAFIEREVEDPQFSRRAAHFALLSKTSGMLRRQALGMLSPSPTLLSVDPLVRFDPIPSWGEPRAAGRKPKNRKGLG